MPLEDERLTVKLYTVVPVVHRLDLILFLFTDVIALLFFFQGYYNNELYVIGFVVNLLSQACFVFTVQSTPSLYRMMCLREIDKKNAGLETRRRRSFVELLVEVLGQRLKNDSRDIEEEEVVVVGWVDPPQHSLSQQGQVCRVYSWKEKTTWRFLYQHVVYEITSLVEEKDGDIIEAKRLPYPSLDEIIKNKRNLQQGLDLDQVKQRLENFGENIIDFPLPEIRDLVKEQASSPFFVFQVLCVGLWMFDDYWIFAFFTLVMLVVFEVVNAHNRRRNADVMRSMLRSPYPVTVVRQGKPCRILSSDLVPGDVIHVLSSTTATTQGKNRNNDDETKEEEEEENALFPCDALLISGSCVVNEAMLTGESTPKPKYAIIIKEEEDDNDEARCVVLGGTVVLQTKSESNGPVLAVVLRTGFGTTQGSLMRTIFASSDRLTAGSWEAYVFMLLLTVVAAFSAGYVVLEGLKDPNRSRWKLFLHAIMIVTSVVPPELPMELSLAVTSSLGRLIQHRVFCTEAFRIPLAGQIDVCCFDKTGTLTSDDVTVNGVYDVNGKVITDLSQNKHVIRVLAYCHELVFLTSQRRFAGDPLEIAALGFVQTHLDPIVASRLLNGRVVRVFPFSAVEKRMSVLLSTGNNNDSMEVLCKGAPEVIQTLCTSVPVEYASTYEALTKKGYRVLALAHRCVKEKSVIGELLKSSVPSRARLAAERELEFCGFLALESPIKIGTMETIQALRESGHRVMMVTGDNAATAEQVALRVGINVTNSALTGNQIDDMDDDTAKIALNNTTVVARASPIQKERVVRLLQSAGFVALMCGDGTNDVGALKRADVGVSVVSSPPLEKMLALKKHNDDPWKEAHLLNSGLVQLGDASIASPFTAKTPSISAVLDVVRQGRCTLVTTVQMFKILASNGLLHSWSMTVLFLRGVRQGDFQGTIAGLVLATCFALLSFTKPLDALSKRRPVARIFSLPVLASIAGQSFIHLCAFVATMELIPERLEECVLPDGDFFPDVVNTLVFEVGFAVQAVVFATNYRGSPFMLPLLENRPLCATLGLMWFGSLGLALGATPLESWFELVPLPNDVKWPFVLVLFVDAVVAFAWEWIVIRWMFHG